MLSTSTDLVQTAGSFSWETIAHICGFVGLVVSLLSGAWQLFQGCERYTIDLIDYSDIGTGVRFYLCVSNLSTQPLVIRSFTYTGTTCELLPKKIRGRVGEFGFQSSPVFPLTIPGRSARGVFVEFLPPGIVSLAPGDRVTLKVETIARSREIFLLLGSRSRYLNNRA